MEKKTVQCEGCDTTYYDGSLIFNEAELAMLCSKCMDVWTHNDMSLPSFYIARGDTQNKEVTNYAQKNR